MLRHRKLGSVDAFIFGDMDGCVAAPSAPVLGVECDWEGIANYKYGEIVIE